MRGDSNFQQGCNLAIDTYFSKDHVVEIDLESNRCVFRLPKTITGTKAEAYAPRRLGLGPYHHLRTNYKMQLHKISRVRSFLGSDKLQVFEQIVGDLVKREPIVRACYDQYLDFDIKTLAGIIALDGLYLLRFLVATNDGGDEMETMEDVVADILMLENQIPVVLYKVVLEVLQQQKIINSAEDVLSTKFGDFCQEHSPLKLENTHRELMNMKQQFHLLDRMYRSIILDKNTESLPTILRISGMQAPPSQILQMVERARELREHFKGSNESDLSPVPTASVLAHIAHLKFKHSSGGIKHIIYDADENTLQLPTIRINGNSEIVLRNLMAYEATVGVTHELAEYLDLMCSLIRTVNDVVILKKAEVIEGELSDERVAGLFDEIGRLMGERRPKQVDKTFDEVWSVKAKMSAKKCLNVARDCVVFIAGVVVVAVLVMQAFCSVFDCYRWTNNVMQGFSDQ